MGGRGANAMKSGLQNCEKKFLDHMQEKNTVTHDKQWLETPAKVRKVLKAKRPRGNVCPARARLHPESYPLMEKAPQIDHDGLRTFPTKHVA